MRAGLEIAAAVTRLETRGTEKLAVRIGIATGLVVVGDLVGEGSAQEQAVVGETPNLAALVRPGTLVVADSTRSRARHAVRDRGSRVPIPLADAAARRSHIVLQSEFRARFPRRADVPFHTRCHRKIGPSCETQKPVEQRLAQSSHRIVCHIPADELARLTAASERTAP